MSLKKVIDCIKRNKNFLITTHTNLEGDALGSELALFMLLKFMRKHAKIINQDNLPYGYDFLPGIHNIKKFNNELKSIRFDCFVILDCSNLKRCGKLHRMIRNRPILNIDHHISNEHFGDVNWVEPKASSCAEMIYKLFKKLGVAFNKYIAMCLYVGILTDTGSFRYSNTTGSVHRAVAQLLRYNLDIVKIYNNIYGNIPFQDMKLLVKILSSIKLQSEGKIAWLQIKRDILKNKKLNIDLTENILNFARSIRDVEVAVVFKENLGVKNEVRVNLRSQGKLDVNKVAKFFGGGGHKTASGCTIIGKIDEVRKKVLKKIRQGLDDNYMRS